MYYPDVYYCSVCGYLRNRRRDGMGPQCTYCQGDSFCAKLLREGAMREGKRVRAYKKVKPC